MKDKKILWKCSCGKEELEITDFESTGGTISIASLPKCTMVINHEKLFDEWYPLYPRPKGRIYKKGMAKKKFKTRIKSHKKYRELIEGTKFYITEHQAKNFKFVIDPHRFLDSEEWVYALERKENDKKDEIILDSKPEGLYTIKGKSYRYICDECAEGMNIALERNGKQYCGGCY